MKRGQMGEADKHAIRRKIEEKQVMVREQRKVRERLSRECADTMFHIASAESAIKSMTAKHEETLKTRAEDFLYSTAADRRQAQQLHEKCAELQRLMTTSDVVEREHAVLTARLEALRLDDEREEVAKAREMDALKRNAFNVRNDLENVFRTTLHDLNVTYQDQAFDAMVEEAKTAKEELPALRRDLRSKTRHANRVRAKHCGSSISAGQAKVERDLADDFVKLQAHREERLRLSLRGQTEAVERQTREMKDLGNDLERFRAEAVELRVAAAELRQLRAESARAQKEYFQAREWALTLANKGPKALKAEMKRRRLASLTAAAVAPFKARASEKKPPGGDDGSQAEEGAEKDNNSKGRSGAGVRENHAATAAAAATESVSGSGSDTDRPSTSSSGRSDMGCFVREEGKGGQGEEDREVEGEEEEEEKKEGDEGEKRRSFRSGSDTLRRQVHRAPAPAARRDTLTLVAGMEVGRLGTSAGAAGTSSGTTRPSVIHDAAAKRPPAVECYRRRGCTDWPEEKFEEIWRASLNSGKHGPNVTTTGAIATAAAVKNTTNNNNDGSTCADELALKDDAEELRFTASSGRDHQQQQQQQTVPPRSEPATSATLPLLASDHLGAPGDRDSTSAAVERREGRSTDKVMAMSTDAVDFSLTLGKLPAEVLASVLLSEHEFGGGGGGGRGKNVASAAGILERAQQHWDRRRWQQHQQEVAVRSQDLPDLPYGFTDLGRRVNVGDDQRNN